MITLNIAGIYINVHNIQTDQFLNELGVYYSSFLDTAPVSKHPIKVIAATRINLSNEWAYSNLHKQNISLLEGRGIYGTYDRLKKEGELFYEPHALSSMDAFIRFVLNLESVNYIRLVIHASGVVVNDGVYLFIGKPGSGKSTIAMLQEEYAVLSDELNILQIENGRLLVHGTPFISSTKSCAPGPYRLKAISVLRKDEYDNIKKISFSAGLSQLINSIVDYSPDNGVKKMFMERFIVPLKNVLFLEIAFRKSADIWDHIKAFDAKMFY